MARTHRKADKVRASRDGHEYHEAWTARKAMQLLLSENHLVGIAVEGLEPGDQLGASAETVEIADLTLYNGPDVGFECAEKVDIVQFKYSPSHEGDDFRASDAKKTIAKFAASYCDYKKRYGARQVEDKLYFTLITNRPVYPPLLHAIKHLATKQPLSGQVKKQAQQFMDAAGISGPSLVAFANKFQISGSSGSLSKSKRDTSILFVDWSATSDVLATARLGNMRDMVRTKAGYAGTSRNVIRDTDVLAALGIPDRDALLPCPTRLPEVGKIVEREQLTDVVALIPTLSKPLLIHSAGGVGKTVFMESLVKALEDRYEIIFFDCFGGGAYRSPEDARHLPEHGLIHIANLLAYRGLCDPILPGSDNLETLLKTFRRRLEQCVKTLSQISPKKNLLILLDAIDNASEHARDRNEESFPTLLLKCFQHNPIPGLTFVVSSRSHRIPLADVEYHDFELRPFSHSETTRYLRARLSHVTETEIHVAQARSDGNPRILEYLVKSGRGLLDPSDINNKIELSDLIEKQMDRALSEAKNRGYNAEDIAVFLAGLAVLPPPVPLDEYAEAHGMEQSAIESFVSDMWPLLERTKLGLMFRDEPTETLVRGKYASEIEPLRRLASKLQARQGTSIYSARSLPGLLYKLGDGEQLFKLAFDDRFPGPTTSIMGKRNIRYARLRAAVRCAADQKDYDRLVHLLLELSTIATVDRRGVNYILDVPDLVIAARDVDAIRRLFETDSVWPGTRHARLTIAHTLSGDLDEASRHAVRTEDWIRHYYQQEGDSRQSSKGPKHLDIAAIPFFFITRGHYDRAINYIRGWKDWYVYEFCEHLFGLLKQRQELSQKNTTIRAFLRSLTNELGCIAAALSFLEIRQTQQQELIEKLRRICRKTVNLEISRDFYPLHDYHLQDGLRKASAIAVSLQLNKEAATIARKAPHIRPDMWSYNRNYTDDTLFSFLYHVALTAALKGTTIREKQIVPNELLPFCHGMNIALSGTAFANDFKKRLKKRCHASHEDTDKNGITYEKQRQIEEFVDHKLSPLLELTKAFSTVLRTPHGQVDDAFICFLKVWEKTISTRGHYGDKEQSNHFKTLGCKIATFLLWTRSDLKHGSARALLKCLHARVPVSLAIKNQIVAIMARRTSLQTLAGEQALKNRTMIEAEKDVTYKATLYATLARAILPASTDDAATYFCAGLDQMDAIGSGDYEFINELLRFASSIGGHELNEREFHTFTNICELNLPEEPEKFPWYEFCKAMSRVSGCRGLAKLSRWDDRSKIPLRYSLLPYLTALVEDDKISPVDALILNRLANPVELYVCNTATLANAIAHKDNPEKKTQIIELISQFKENNPGLPMDSTVKELADIAKKVLGKRSTITRNLTKAYPHFAHVREIQNQHGNYSGRERERINTRPDIQNKAEFKKIVRKTNPLDSVSLCQAFVDVKKIDKFYYPDVFLFERLRSKVQFGERVLYLQVLANLECLSLFSKLNELKICKSLWSSSTVTLNDTYKDLAFPLLRFHRDEIVNDEHLYGYMLTDISEVLGTPISLLALELIKLYTAQDVSVPPAVWLGVASYITDLTGEGKGQAALKHLLESQTTKLSSTVVDGEWRDGAYPRCDIVEIMAGLMWRMLGSPDADDRWQAAHSVRCCAKFGRWNVIDALVGMIANKDAGSFQAPELPFYYMHARLWLLIALARIALDNPKSIAKYCEVLLAIVRNEFGPHILMRHFAARALIASIDAKEIELPVETESVVRTVDRPAQPRITNKIKTIEGFIGDRPDHAPKSRLDFHLDYDFHKTDVRFLSDVFGKPTWEVADRISEVVANIDPNVKGMYDSGGRENSYEFRTIGMTSRYHTYGQQLGWHALHLVAGEFLNKYSVTADWFYDEPWDEWRDRYLLTRSDGLWLADGVDPTPLDVVDILLEKGDNGLVITGDKTKLLRLVGLDFKGSGLITVSGLWHSTDPIKVSISSALVASRKAARVAKNLISEEPMQVWLPEFDEDSENEDCPRNDKSNCVPWVVSLSCDSKIDKCDPLGSSRVQSRPRIVRHYASLLGLRSNDPFGRVWTNSRGQVLARSQAWGREFRHGEEPAVSGVRLLCSRTLLKDLLTRNASDLLILIVLGRYEKGHSSHFDGKFSNTIAVIRVKKTLDITYYKGRINYLHRPKRSKD